MTTAPPRPTGRHPHQHPAPYDRFVDPRVPRPAPHPPAWHVPQPQTVWDVPAGLAVPPRPAPARTGFGTPAGTALAVALAVLFAALGVWGVVALVGAVGELSGGPASGDTAGTRGLASGPVVTGGQTRTSDTYPYDSAGSAVYRNVTGLRGTTLTAGTMQLTAPKLQKVMYLGTVPTKCTTVTYANLGADSVWIGQLDWTLRSPSGVTMSPTYAAPATELGSGYLDPGATASGDVCFATEEALAGWDLLYASGHDSSAPTAVFTG